MRKNLLPLFSLFLVLCMPLPLLAFGHIGNGDLKTEQRKTGTFNSINMSGMGQLRVTRGVAFLVEVTMDSNLLPHYSTEARNGELKLGFEQGYEVFNVRSILVKITLPELEGLSVSGSGDIVVADLFTGDRLKLNVSGSGSLDGDFEYKRIDMGISGSGEVRLAGQVDDIRIMLSGSGSFDGRNLAGVRATVIDSGSGRVVLRVSDKLDATVSGSGSVTYFGRPAVNTRISGSGRVSQGKN